MVEVGKAVIHEDVAFIWLLQVEGDCAGTRLCAVPAEVLGTVEAGAVRVNSSVINLKLLDVVGRYVQADADGDEYESDDEEGRQHGARGEDGLPGGQPLLFKRGIFGLLAPQSPATGPGHGDVPILVFGVVTRRHHDRCSRFPKLLLTFVSERRVSSPTVTNP